MQKKINTDGPFLDLYSLVRLADGMAHLLRRKFKSQKILYNFWHWFVALFTKPIKNWGVPEMIYGEFLPWSKNCRWNRVKMVKNVPKMAEIISGTSYMVDNNIFNIFSFFNFFLRILFRPCFLEFFLKIQTNYRGSTVPKRKSWKTKKGKNVIIYHIWGPQNNFIHFFVHIWQFLPYFTCNFCSTAKIRHRSFQGPPNSWSAW